MSRGPATRRALPALAVLALLAGTASAGEPDAAEPDAAAAEAEAAEPPEEDEGPGVVHRVVAYLPNRVLDLLDVVRLRARVGPGVAAGVRATELVDFYLGSYAALYAGLPGPRGGPRPKLPVGVESNSGLEVSAIDLTTGVGSDPDYSDTEFGVSIHLIAVGVDVGFDPWELVDFVAGFLLLDVRHDDL